MPEGEDNRVQAALSQQTPDAWGGQQGGSCQLRRGRCGAQRGGVMGTGRGGLTPLEAHDLLPHVYFAYGKDSTGRGVSRAVSAPPVPPGAPAAPRTLGEDVNPASLIEFLQDEIHPALVDAVPCRDQGGPRLN